jgi:hypothetical protein
VSPPVIAASLLTAALSAGAQPPAVVRGRVIADDTGRAIANACVSIDGNADSAVATTDASGLFLFRAGEQMSSSEFLAALTGAATRLTLERGQRARINLHLSPR